MKFGIKKKFLATAICLALSTGSAFAMPSGGSVQSGDISGVDAGTLVNGATITAATNGVINWSDFGIAAGEVLNIDVINRDTVLLNRVIGNNISEIWGTLNQTGQGGMILANPNGILVGSGAIVNANDLTFMAMDITPEQFYGFINGNTDIVNVKVKDANNPAKIAINGGTFSLTDKLNLIGGSVVIADGVTISGPDDAVGSQLDNIRIRAANDVSLDDHMNVISVVADDYNSVEIGKAELNSNEDFDVFSSVIRLNGTKVNTGMIALKGAITMKDSELNSKNIEKSYDGLESIVLSTKQGHMNIENSTIKNESGHISVLTGYEYNSQPNIHEFKTKDKISIKDSTIESADKFRIYGYSVDMDNSTVQSDGSLSINALEKADYSEGTKDVATINNTININTSALSGASVDIVGGKINIKDATLTSVDDTAVQDVFISAGSSISGDDSGMNLVTAEGNDITISGSTINNKSFNSSGMGPTESGTKIYGSSVTVNDSEVLSNGDIELFALKSFVEADNGKKLDFVADGNVNKLTVDSSKINSNQSDATTRSDAVMFGGSVDITGESHIEAPLKNSDDPFGKGAGIDIFALSSAKVDDATDTFDLKANADNKLTIADTVTLADGNNGPQGDLPGIYAGAAIVDGTYYGTEGEQTINRGDKGAVYATILTNSTPTPDPVDIDIKEDTPIEEINKAVSNITTSEDVANALEAVLSSDLSAGKKQQVVKAVMESSPVMAARNQEIKNQDAASQSTNVGSTSAATPVDAGADVSAGGDTATAPSVSIDGNPVDSNNLEEE